MLQLFIKNRLALLLVMFCFISALTGCSGTVKKPEITIAAPKVAAPLLSTLHQAEYQEALGLMQTNKFSEAETIFNQLISVYPNLAGAYVNLAFMQEAKLAQEEADKYFNKALEINPNNTDALLALANSNQKKGDFKKAEILLLTAQTSNTKNAIVQYNLAVLYELYLQQYDDAIEHYENYIALTSSDDKETVKRWIKLLERK